MRDCNGLFVHADWPEVGLFFVFCFHLLEYKLKKLF
jgi:hypothetical protein